MDLFKTTAGALIASVALCAPVAAQELPADIEKAGEIKIALFPAFPPLAYRDTETDELTGLDVKLAEEIAQDLGVSINWQEVSYDAAVPALATGRVDLAFSMVNRPESQEVLDFVDYIRSGAQLYSKAADAEEFTQMTDLCGKTVGGSRRTAYPADAEAWSEANCVAAGLPPMEVIGTEGSADARVQLKQGRIDAVVQSSESVPWIMSQEEGEYHLIGEPFANSFISIAFTKDSTELRDAIMSSLRTLYEDGRYQQILADTGLQVNEIEAISINGTPVE
ncbi:ABC transporter substrate-binding protein [Roseovarius aquimarinus]|uniref:ABC transporter substrate-binding protein n=1 Tax=Roseovarius aquimarinus TaxID=1229156 RepID=A0ABW7I7F9_9RHOB